MESQDIIAMYDGEFAESYNETVLKEYKYTAHSVIPAFLICKLSKAMRGTLKVLDLGCGTGLSALEFFKTTEAKEATEQSLSFSVWGMDLSAPMLAKARRLPYQQLLCGNIEDESGLPFPRQFFDIVVMIGVLEFIRDLDKVFVTIKTVLKPGGWLGFAVPNKLPRKQEAALSIRTYDPEKVTAAVERAGFVFFSGQRLPAYEVDGVQVSYTVMYCQLSDDKNPRAEPKTI